MVALQKKTKSEEKDKVAKAMAKLPCFRHFFAEFLSLDYLLPIFLKLPQNSKYFAMSNIGTFSCHVVSRHQLSNVVSDLQMSAQ